MKSIGVLLSLTLLVACNAQDVINVDYPREGQTVNDTAIEFKGKLLHPKEMTAPLVKVELDGYSYDVTEFEADGSYAITILSKVGKNAAKIKIFDGSQSVSTLSRNYSVALKGLVQGAVTANKDTVLTGTENNAFKGVSLSFPKGSLGANNSFYLNPIPDDEKSSVPYRYLDGSLGLKINFAETLKQLAPVELKLPLVKAPEGSTLADAVILMKTYKGVWSELPTAFLDATSIKAQLPVLSDALFVLAFKKTLAARSVLIDSDIPGALIYLDGVPTFLNTPAVLKSVPIGPHTITTYIPGLNESRIPFNSSTSGVSLSISSSVPKDSIPQITLDSSIPDRIVTPAAVTFIYGKVLLDGVAFGPGSGVITQGNEESTFSISPEGLFNIVAPASKSEAKIQLRVTSAAGNTGVSKELTLLQSSGGESSSFRLAENPGIIAVEVPSQYLREEEDGRQNKKNSPPTVYVNQYVASGEVLQAMRSLQLASVPSVNGDIRVVLRWNTPDTDIDLQIEEEGGGVASYSSPAGIEGASLDIDDIDGYGPEVFSFVNPRSGRYKISLSYNRGSAPTTAYVSVHVGKEVRFNGSYLLQPNNIRNPHVIEISDLLSLNSIESYRSSEAVYPARCAAYENCRELPFSSLPGENQIRVSTNLGGLEASEIEYTVLNKNNGQAKVLRTADISDVALDFIASNALKEASRPIVLEITAKIIGGERDGEMSKPYLVVQDVKDQLRQEYADLVASSPLALQKIAIPTRDQILNAAQWVQKLAASSPLFAPSAVVQADESVFLRTYGYMVVDQAFAMIGQARTAYGKDFALTNIWSSPNLNALTELPNRVSPHLKGSSADLDVQRASLSIADSGKAIRDLCDKALVKLGSGYKRSFHGGHCHLEAN